MEAGSSAFARSVTARDAVALAEAVRPGVQEM